MVFTRTLLAVFFLLTLAGAYAAEWQYAGNAGKDKASFLMLPIVKAGGDQSHSA